MEDHASSSAHDARSHRRHVRNRAGTPAYTMPGQKTLTFTICDQYGSTIEPALNPLARALILFDLALLRRVYTVLKKDVSSANEARKNEAVRIVEEYNEIRRQWKEIDSGRSHFSQSYLQDDHFIPFWMKGLRIVKEVLKNNNMSGNCSQKRSDFVDILADYENRACNLEGQLMHAARKGLLKNEILLSIQERWIRLDELLNWYYDMQNKYLDEDTSRMSRYTPTWQKLLCLIETNQPKIRTDKDLIQSITSVKLIESKGYSAFILWSALFGSAVTSLAFFALGCVHSPHIRGTTNDADFWFLTQAAIMQLLGLVVSALLERRSGSLPRWRWALPTIIAAAFSIAAVPLYLAVPTEWSAFLSLVAGATQSFMVLQHFLSSSESNIVLRSS